VRSTSSPAQLNPQQSPTGKKTICASRNPKRAKIWKRETEEKEAYQLEAVDVVLEGIIVLLLLLPLASALDRFPHSYGHRLLIWKRKYRQIEKQK
jgi:diadenosine tetraphosphate (Ap4A) HIT family hydrolase